MEGTLLELPRLVKTQIYQKFNLLSEKDFAALQDYNKFMTNFGHGTVRIHQDESVTSEINLEHGKIEHPMFFVDYKNDLLDIEHYIPFLGEHFRLLLESIRQAMIEQGAVNPQLHTSRFCRNNLTTSWHRHQPLKGYSYLKNWCSIYYMHPNWDSENWGGDVNVGIIETENVWRGPSASNSVIWHDAYYGHGISKVHLGYPGNRDMLVNHWVSD